MPSSIPILRFGKAYESLETAPVKDARGGDVLATIGQSNAGLIRRDLRRVGKAAAALRARPAAELWDLFETAGDLFMNAALPAGSGDQTHTPDQYVQVLSATSGLPHTLCRRNMEKIHHVFTHIRTIVRGLTRGLDDTNIFDSGRGEHDGVPVSFVPMADALGVVLPSNSPGVNSIWLPALALKTPVLLKPGREEPWTPWRIIAALQAAGFPAEAFGFYPTDHEGADAILSGCGRAIIFGDDSTLSRYAMNPAVQTHGTGRSKILMGDDLIDDWQKHIQVLVDSIVDNGGRSCINVSCILVPRHADAIGEALATRLAEIEPRSAQDPNAVLSAFANADFARHIDGVIDEGLSVNGVVDVTAAHRGPRLVELDGAIFLRPTVVRCSSLSHPLGNTEFLFPFTSVVETPQDKMLEQIGPTLVLSALSRDEAFIDELLRCPLIDRLNIGPLPTSRVQWDQPHEGNLFDFLYRRRAIQCAPI